MAPLYPFARCCLTMLAISAAILALLGTGMPAADAAPAGRLVTWGDDNGVDSGVYGVLGNDTPPPVRATPGSVLGPGGAGPLAGVSALSAGWNYSLAVQGDGTVLAWGFNNDGQLGDGTTAERMTPVHVVGSTGSGFLTGITAVSAGYDSCLALKQDGTVWAWGDNGGGGLGDGTTTDRHTPVQVVGPGGVGTAENSFLSGVIAVSKRGPSLALKKDGTVWAWGGNYYGELGDGTTTDRHIPVQVVGPGGVGFLTGIMAVSGGVGRCLALKQDGTVWSWGWNGYGGLGDGTYTDRHTPVQVAGPGGTGFLSGIVAVSAGAYHNLALKQDGTVWSWGENDYGELGDGQPSYASTPVQVVGPGGSGFLTGVMAVSAGFGFSLAIKRDGTVWAWGDNEVGALGDGIVDYVNHPTPVQVVGPAGSGFLTGVAEITAGGYYGHSLALNGDGTVCAWGDNTAGELGDGYSANNPVPTDVVLSAGPGSLTGITAVSTGDLHSLAVKQDGTVWAWGHNYSGELGDGTTTDRHAAVQVVGPGGAGSLTGVISVAAAQYYSVVLKQDGTVWTWGGASKTPVQVAGPGGVGFLTGIVAIAAGEGHNLALKDDGTVWAWGYDFYGQLGDGTTNYQVTPVQVVGPGGSGFLTGITAISAAGSNEGNEYSVSGHSLALKQDGTVWAWGEGGALGDGTTTERHTPVQVLGPGGSGFLTGVTAISTAEYHSLAVKQDGTVWAWGLNGGALGDGTTTNRLTPVQVLGPGGSGFLTGVIAVSAGGFDNLALKQDGTLWGWGYNRDGELGIGVADNDPHFTPIQVIGRNGTGFLQKVTAIAAGAGHSLAIVAQATPFDFNADGQADLLWQNQATGGVTAWLMNGVQYSGVGSSVVDSSSWKIVGAADFNGDGSPDLVWQNPGNGAVYVWYMNGVQYSGNGGSIADAADPAWKVVGTPDLNGDGHPDILWQNSTTGAVLYWLMNGTQFTGQSGYIAASADPAWKVVGTPDLNGDGSPDILWQNSTTGGVYVWYMNGATYSGTGAYVATSVDPAWKVVGVPDLNGDGQPDLLWQNSTTGGVTYWLMNGARYTGQGGSIVDSADPNWQIVGIH